MNEDGRPVHKQDPPGKMGKNKNKKNKQMAKVAAQVAAQVAGQVAKHQKNKGGGKAAQVATWGQGRGGNVPPNHRLPVVLRVLKLNDDSNEQLDKLFSMIDADNSRSLQLHDFEILASKAAIGPMVAKTRSVEYFTKLQQELDANDDGYITKEEFTRGIIKLALQKPAGPMLHSLAGSSDLSAVMAACEMKTNFEVQELCKVLYNWMCGLVRE